MNGFFVGDIIGNSYAHENKRYNKKTKNFELFTKRSKFSDDTILTFATMQWLTEGEHTSKKMLSIIKNFYKKFPDTKPTIYGEGFANWVESGCQQFRASAGNGGAMRASPIGWYAKDMKQLRFLVSRAVRPTHNTPEGRQGAKVVATSIFLLRRGYDLNQLRKYIDKTYHYNLKTDINEYREKYKNTSSAKETVRPALVSLLNSNSFEDSIRNAVSFGGDTDTITSICAAISEAYYKDIPKKILTTAKKYLPKEFKELLKDFNKKINDDIIK